MAKDMFYLFFSEEGDGEDASEHGQKCGVGFFCCFLAACPLQSQLPLRSHSVLAAVVVFASVTADKLQGEAKASCAQPKMSAGSNISRRSICSRSWP